MNLLGGVGVAVVMGVGGAEVGVGGSDSDERKQTPVLAEDDQEGSCFAGFMSGFSAIAQTMGVLERTVAAGVRTDSMVPKLHRRHSLDRRPVSGAYDRLIHGV